MAWNSNEPRRSGAFRIQIVDKAHSQFKEQIKNIKDNIKEKMNHLVKNNSNIEDNKGDKEKEFDPILRPGDSFRLISLKFPDFELGLTSVKIRDEYCYLGLRKVWNDVIFNPFLFTFFFSFPRLIRLVQRKLLLKMMHGVWK